MKEGMDISQLIGRYNTGIASADDLATIEQLVGSGKLNLEDLKDLADLEKRVEAMEMPAPSMQLDDRFYETLAREKKALRNSHSFRDWFATSFTFPRLAFAAALFAGGLALGYVVFNQGSPERGDMTALTEEVKNLKEMMMLSLLENEAATDRLKAVGMSEEIGGSNEKVIGALIKTLNNDENANVRLAALEALTPYVRKSEVREELIRSIALQDSPLVQIALAELMASLQEKASVKEFDKLLKDERTPGEVKSRIRKSIEVLI